MFLLFVTLLLSSIVIGYDIDRSGTSTIAQQFMYDSALKVDFLNPCATIVAKYYHVKDSDIPEEDRDEARHCYFRILWISEKNERVLYNGKYNTTCDILMLEIPLWSTADVIEKAMLKDCRNNWLAVDIAKREIPELAWLPNSIAYDNYMPYIIANDVMQCFFINRQFNNDRKENFTIFKSDNFQAAWKAMGLSVEHYTNPLIVDDASLSTFLQSSTIEDYIKWNSVESCIAYDSIIKLAGKSEVFSELVHSALTWINSMKEKMKVFNQ